MVVCKGYRVIGQGLCGIRSRPISPVHTRQPAASHIALPGYHRTALTDELTRDKYIHYPIYIASLTSLDNINDQYNSIGDRCNSSQVMLMTGQVTTPPPCRRVDIANACVGGRKKCVDFLDPDKLGIHSNTIQV